MMGRGWGLFVLMFALGCSTQEESLETSAVVARVEQCETIADALHIPSAETAATFSGQLPVGGDEAEVLGQLEIFWELAGDLADDKFLTRAQPFIATCAGTAGVTQDPAPDPATPGAACRIASGGLATCNVSYQDLTLLCCGSYK